MDWMVQSRLLMPLMVILYIPLLCAHTCLANNTSFLPGDAFFYCRLDADDIAALMEEESAIFTYGSRRDGGLGCGSAGYVRANDPNMQRSCKQSLLHVYERLKPSIQQDGYGKKKMNIFFYNPSYDWQKHGLAIQYNENWANETAAFGYQLDQLILQNFIQPKDKWTAKESVLEKAWRDSPRIKPLDATLAPLPSNPDPRVAFITPIILKQPYQIVIIPNRNFHDYYEKKDGMVVAVIKKETVTWFQAKEGNWKSVPDAMLTKVLRRGQAD